MSGTEKLILLCIALILTAIFWPAERDSTDAPNSRSGLRLYRDHMTGCEYLGGSGGITPRLDEQARPICGRR